MAYKDKVRVNIALDPSVNNRLIEMSKRMGISKTNLCAMMICQQIDTFEMTYDLLQNPNKLRAILDESYKGIQKDLDIISNAFIENGTTSK